MHAELIQISHTRQNDTPQPVTALPALPASPSCNVLEAALDALASAPKEVIAEQVFRLFKMIHRMDATTVVAAYQTLTFLKEGQSKKHHSRSRRLIKATITRMLQIITNTPEHERRAVAAGFRAAVGIMSEMEIDALMAKLASRRP